MSAIQSNPAVKQAPPAQQAKPAQGAQAPKLPGAGGAGGAAGGAGGKEELYLAVGKAVVEGGGGDGGGGGAASLGKAGGDGVGLAKKVQPAQGATGAIPTGMQTSSIA